MHFFEVALQLSQEKKPFVTVTVVSGRGHTPQDPGAKAIVTTEGLLWGTVGGGKVEARAIQHAQMLLAQAGPCIPELLTWNLQRDIGMTCGGELTYLFETQKPAQWHVAVFGAGHVAQSLVRTLLTLQCSVTCVDARPEWVEKLPAHAHLSAQSSIKPEAIVPTLSPETFFVVMTQGHASDVPILHKIFETNPNPHYVGVIGSTLKGNRIKSELKQMGTNEEMLGRLRCPIGLDIGNNDPAEIAISIAAELIQVRDRIWSNAKLSARET